MDDELERAILAHEPVEKEGDMLACTGCDWEPDYDAVGLGWAAHVLAAAQPEPLIEPSGSRPVDIPVIEGIATLPDGRQIASRSRVVRVVLPVYE